MCNPTPPPPSVPVRPRLPTVLLVAVAAGLAGVHPARGQERPPAPEIVPDRPGLGDGVHGVASGVFQLETGVEVADRGPDTEWSLGQAVLRFGAGPLELRALLDSYVLRRGGVDDQGFRDVAVGAKVGVAEDARERARLSALGTLSLPTGSSGFGTDQATAGATALGEWTPGGGPVSVAANAGVTLPLERGDPAWRLVVTPGASIDGVEGLGAYGGWAGFFAGGGDRHWLEAGLTYLLDRETQLDLNGGWSPDGDHAFLGMGLARRVR